MSTSRAAVKQQPDCRGKQSASAFHHTAAAFIVVGLSPFFRTHPPNFQDDNHIQNFFLPESTMIETIGSSSPDVLLLASISV
jgi:hypothetical protein